MSGSDFSAKVIQYSAQINTTYLVSKYPRKNRGLWFCEPLKAALTELGVLKLEVQGVAD
jgi:hypothetical protein